jgi:hypothetical protein
LKVLTDLELSPDDAASLVDHPANQHADALMAKSAELTPAQACAAESRRGAGRHAAGNAPRGPGWRVEVLEIFNSTSIKLPLLDSSNQGLSVIWGARCQKRL